MANNKVEFSLEVKDQASAKLKKALDESVRSFKNVEKESQKSSQSSSQALSKLQREHQRTYSAYERLGLCSERQIQREIQRTEASYNRLARSGKLSGTELSRAANQAKTQIAQLRNELGQTEKQASKLQKSMQVGGSIAKGAIQVGAGLWAAKQVVDPQLQAKMERDRNRRSVTNIMADGAPIEERRVILGKVKQAARNAAKMGGTEDEALESIGTLAAGGGLSEEQIFSSAQTIAKVQVATVFDATQKDLALATNSILKFGIAANQLEDTFGMLVTSGNEGAFEIADMAKELPTLLSDAKGLGMNGRKDLALITTLAQTSRMVTGTSPEAATVTSRYLSSLNSSNVKKALTDAGVKNIEAEYRLGLENGKSVIETNAALVQKVIEKDPQYKKMVALREQLAGTKDNSEREDILNKQMRLLEGSKAGEIFPDLMSRKGFMGVFNNKEQFDKILASTLNSNASSINDAYEFGKESDWAKELAYQSKRQEGQEDSIAPLSNVLNDLKSGFVEYTNKYPEAIKWIEGATTSLKALAAAAAAAGVTSMVMNGGKGGLMSSLLSRLGGGAAATAATGGLSSISTGGITAAGSSAATSAAAGGGMGLLGSAGWALAPLTAMAGVTAWANKKDHKTEISFLQKHTDRMKNWFGIDPKAAEKKMYENRLKDGLGGNSVPEWYMQERAVKNWDGTKETNPAVIALQQLEPLLTGASTDMNTSAQGFTESSTAMQQAADTMNKAANTPIQVQITVTPTDGLFNVIAEKQTQNNRRN